LTDAPLIGIAATWMATSESGIARRAVPWARSARVESRITATKTAVKTTSTTIAAHTSDACVVVAATTLSSYAINTTIEATIAPTTCATQ
jgi:hypothetical protein